MKKDWKKYFFVFIVCILYICVGKAVAQKDIDFKVNLVKKFVSELTFPNTVVKDNIFTIAIVDNNGTTADAFTNSLGNTTIKGLKVNIKRITNVSEITLFPIVYYTENASMPASAIARAVGKKPMIFLTETEGSIATGSDVNFVKKGGSWRYEINSDAIRKKRINPSETFVQKAVSDTGTITGGADITAPDNRPKPVIQDEKLLARIKELEGENGRLSQKIREKEEKEAEEARQREKRKTDLNNLKNELDNMTDIADVRKRALEEAGKAKEEAEKAEQERINRIKAENDAKDKEREAKRQKEIDNQRLYMIGLAGIIAVISTIAILSVIASRRRKKIIDQLEIARNELSKNNAQLDMQNKEILAQRNELDVQNKEIMAQKDELADKNLKITDSIRYAETIQMAMLPSRSELSQIFKSYFVMYEPKDIVSGDFYWATKREEGIFVAVADCTGHGVPGAFLSTVGNDILNELIKDRRVHEPNQILTNLHTGIFERLRQGETNNQDGMDICLCRIVEKDDDYCEIVFAGAKRPIFYSDAGEIRQLKGDSKYLGGIKEEPPSFTNQVVTLKKGEILYLTTDGYPDTPNTEKRKFGSGKFQELMQEVYSLDLPTQHKIFMERWREHKGKAELRDDTTILAIEL